MAVVATQKEYGRHASVVVIVLAAGTIDVVVVVVFITIKATLRPLPWARCCIIGTV
jgi:hypothetical protein